MYLTVGALVEGIGVLLLLPLFSVVIGTSSGNGWIDGLSRWVVDLGPGSSTAAKLSFLLVLFALLVGFRALIILERDVLIERLQTGFVEDHRLRIVTLLAQCRWEVVARLKHGRITHILSKDVDQCGIAALLLARSAVALALLAGQGLLVVLLSPTLAFAILLLLGIGAIAFRPVLRRSSELGQDLAESNLRLIIETGEFLAGLKLALSQNLQRSFLSEFEAVQQKAVERQVGFTRHRTTSQLSLSALVALVGGIAILLGAGVLAIAPAALFAFLFVLARMNGPVAQIQSSLHYVFHSLPTYRAVKRLESELLAGQQAGPTAGPAPGEAPTPSVELDRVTFFHLGSPKPAVGALSMRIESGECVGLVGPSGAGKTTLADLIVGLYPPKEGTVSVGGRALNGETIDAWRRSLSYVSQDPFLFHDSVRRNLLWARPEASDAEMWAALELASAAGIVRQLDGGLDSVVGERGTLLSGGERQRIALARAIIRRPQFLLLDEATSAIDVATEQEIFGRLRSLSPRPTILIITHREESLRLCDRVIEIREGYAQDA